LPPEKKPAAKGAELAVLPACPPPERSCRNCQFAQEFLLAAPNGFQQAVVVCIMRQWPQPVLPDNLHHNPGRFMEKAKKCGYFTAGIAQVRIDIEVKAGENRSIPAGG
jgi:hypothetical protein